MLTRRQVTTDAIYLCAGVRLCSDGSAPLCADGSAPVRDLDRATPPCPGQGRGRAAKPSTCPDGRPPVKQGGRRGQGRGRGQGGRRGGGRGEGRGQGRRGGRGRGRGGRGGGRCPVSRRVCCDGSAPSAAGSRAPVCSDGTRARCSCRNV